MEPEPKNPKWELVSALSPDHGWFSPCETHIPLGGTMPLSVVLLGFEIGMMSKRKQLPFLKEPTSCLWYVKARHPAKETTTNTL